MAAITAAMVKELRERTGLGMMECKKALVEAEGNVETAIEELRKSSGLKAAKKAGRTAAEGVSLVKVSDDNTVAFILEVNSETDFVARDDNFMTSVPGVFVAGDMGRGQSLIVWAIAEGRSAAAGADSYLMSQSRLPAPIKPGDRPLM